MKPPSAGELKKEVPKMIYGLNPQLFVEDGPALHAASIASARNFARFHHWRGLDSRSRLEAVEQALKQPANDLIDEYPVAL